MTSLRYHVDVDELVREVRVAPAEMVESKEPVSTHGLPHDRAEELRRLALIAGG